VLILNYDAQRTDTPIKYQLIVYVRRQLEWK